MPKMYTNRSSRPVQPKMVDPKDSCVSTYEEYKAQRVLIDNVSFAGIQQCTALFKGEVITPLRSARPNLEMGEYFIIPVSEILEMLKACPEAEFLSISNGLRDTQNSSGVGKNFPVAILTPLLKARRDGNDTYDTFQEEGAIYCEAYPCPPDPSCPKIAGIGTILMIGTKPNDFKSLF